MTRRQRQLEELGALCRSGSVSRAVDLAFEHFASFGRDDDVVALLLAALDGDGTPAAARGRLGELLLERAPERPRSALPPSG